MSVEIENAFEHALLAQVAYENLTPEMDSDEIKVHLANRGWPPSLAQYFIEHFDVVFGNVNAANGYDALVLRRSGTDQYILANRGTNDPADLSSDLQLAAFGICDQVSTMEAYIETNVIPLASIPGVTFEVVGHSLGGFLTAWARMLYPEIFTAGYTYNGAGVGNLTVTLINRVLEFLGREPLTIGGDTKNFYVSEWPEVVSSVGVYSGSRTSVNVDQVEAFGHGVAPLTNALFVAHVLGAIDESLTITQINRLMEAMSSENNLDRNTAFSYLGKLLGFPNANIMKKGIRFIYLSPRSPRAAAPAPVAPPCAR